MPGSAATPGFVGRIFLQKPTCTRRGAGAIYVSLGAGTDPANPNRGRTPKELKMTVKELAAILAQQDPNAKGFV